uniref:30S ribosomal protein S16, chloroplastic n=4 Tax=Mesangiospermae TaxID=1437183 RepID=A0A4D6G269_9POAL|nr:ribosomal protein S16 [Urochondra setulosa]QCB91952.1 ribosomal protein S16 [Urochondra setulosa]
MVKLRLKRCGRKQRATWKEIIDCGFCYPPFSIVMKMVLARHSLFYLSRTRFALSCLGVNSTRWSSRRQNGFFIKGKNLGLVKTNKLGQLCQSILNIEMERFDILSKAEFFKNKERTLS